MKFGIHTLDDFDYSHKTVLVRVDFNQPINKETQELESIKRIQAALETLQELIAVKAKVIVLTHQGSDIEYENYNTTKPHAKVLETLLEYPVEFVEDVCGPYAQKKIQSMKPGDVIMLDNVRFMAEEQTLFELKLKLSLELQSETQVVRKLAPLIDYYICDAFAATHRSQPSLCGFQLKVPSAMGRLFEKEYEVVSNLIENPLHTSIFVLGGAKINDALDIIETVLENKSADSILTGGLVSHIFLHAKGIDIGDATRNFLDKKGFLERTESVKRILDIYGDQIILPVDLAYVSDNIRYESDFTELCNDVSYVDIGEKTATQYAQIIESAASVFVNGPVGIFEETLTEFGTKTIWDALKVTQAYTVVGGGDSIRATEKYQATQDINYICTGGGALIQFLSGKELPVIKALKINKEKVKI